MKDVYESFIAIRNPPLLNYWKSIILSQFINETYVSLPWRCSRWRLQVQKKLAPALSKEMIPQS